MPLAPPELLLPSRALPQLLLQLLLLPGRLQQLPLPRSPLAGVLLGR